jgi:hypothetical protein
VNIESEANKDLALESEAAENVVGGTGKKKTKAQRHVVTKSRTILITEPPLGADLGNEGIEAPVPVDPDTGYSL